MYSVELGDVNPQILEGLNSVQHPRCHWLQQAVLQPPQLMYLASSTISRSCIASTIADHSRKISLCLILDLPVGSPNTHIVRQVLCAVSNTLEKRISGTCKVTLVEEVVDWVIGKRVSNHLFDGLDVDVNVLILRGVFHCCLETRR